MDMGIVAPATNSDIQGSTTIVLGYRLLRDMSRACEVSESTPRITAMFTAVDIIKSMNSDN